MSETSPVRSGEHIDAERLRKYLEPHLGPWPSEPLRITQFVHGRSNLTYLLQVGDWQAVLRRPPYGTLAPRSHDMAREFAWLQAIHPVFPWAPNPLWLCTDPEVIGATFLVMEKLPGVVVAERFPTSVSYTPELGAHLCQLMADRLIDLHRIPWEMTQVGTWVKPEGFLPRQVRGWIDRYQQAKIRPVKGEEALIDWLVAHIPLGRTPTLIHYDYKLNNVSFRPDWTDIAGVFDWEMATVGDPLADLAVAMSYWVEATDPPWLQDVLGPSVTTWPGFWTRHQWLEVYSRQSGRRVDNWPFYLTFAYFKLGVIVAQIYARYAHGQTQDHRFQSFDQLTEQLIQYALATCLNT